jgi:hypothetical protein
LLFLELNAHFGLFGLSEEISVLEGEEYSMHALPEFEDLKYGTTDLDSKIRNRPGLEFP